MSASIASAKEANKRYSTYFLTSCQYLFRGNPYFKLNNFLIVSEVIKTLLFVEILFFLIYFPLILKRTLSIAVRPSWEQF